MSADHSKHTSGPWRVYHAPLRPRFSGIKIIEIQDDHCNPVVTWSGFDNSDRLKKTHLANARLMAAAPDMLAALQAALPHLDNAGSPGGCDGSQTECAHCEAIRMTQAAIKRATKGACLNLTPE